MSFVHTFRCWLNESLAQDVPDSVKAFSFNLFEPAMVDGVKFGVEVVGTGEFDEDDPDWACDEVWEPVPRGICIPVDFSSEEWETCTQKLKILLLGQLEVDSPAMGILKSRNGIGLGFIDGDLEIIWKP
ncbi:MAG: hypothetical protein JJU29_04270 [Verrucomicrobia bacterium]|nr:hypothetical protein [Verrucomicrobiota bacterium]MCH8512050.1 hypothetical protein [Kiritimatiellia bacterium]